MPNGLDVLKEALGLAGSLSLAWPWLRDFRLRLRRRFVDRLPAGGGMVRVRQHLVESFKQRIDQPKTGDLVATILGLIALALSFLIGLAQALFMPAAP